jgi:hypothetical protein
MSSILDRIRKKIMYRSGGRGKRATEGEGEKKRRRIPNEWNELTRWFFFLIPFLFIDK